MLPAEIMNFPRLPQNPLTGILFERYLYHLLHRVLVFVRGGEQARLACYSLQISIYSVCLQQL